MTRIDFYAGSDDVGRTIFALVQKAVRSGHRVWILTRDPGHSAEVDAQLWSSPPGGFLPHCLGSHELAVRTPVVIDHDAGAVPHEDILLNLSESTPPCFSRFGRMLEVVGSEPTALQAARERFRFYRDRGYPLHHHDLRHRT